MEMPGEALIAKLWESIADKAIGNLLKPWQIRREGRAQIDVKREEVLILAQAERDAEAIRRGELRIKSSVQPLSLSASRCSSGQTDQRDLKFISTEHATPLPIEYTVATQAAHADMLRKEVNVARAILHAEDSLRDDPQTPPSQKPEEDWLYKWRDYASAVSEDELQQLWGRVLAGEIKAPGSFSVRLLNFLHNLDCDDARLIASLMPFVIYDFIAKDAQDSLISAGLTFDRLLYLQELGVVTGVDGLGLSKTYSGPPNQHLRILLRSYQLGLGATSTSEQASVEIPAYILTRIGQQLVKLGNFEADIQYLRKIGLQIKSKGFEVQMGLTADFGHGVMHLLNSETL